MSTIESNQYSVITLQQEYDTLDKVYRYIIQRLNEYLDEHIQEDYEEARTSFEDYVFPTIKSEYSDLKDYEINREYCEFDESPNTFLIIQDPSRDCYNVEVYNILTSILGSIQVNLRKEHWAWISGERLTGGTNYYTPNGDFVDVQAIYRQLARISS